MGCGFLLRGGAITGFPQREKERTEKTNTPGKNAGRTRRGDCSQGTNPPAGAHRVPSGKNLGGRSKKQLVAVF